jgi:hypothetical protein
MSGSSPSALLQVKGSALRGRLSWVKEMYGQTGLKDLTQDLSPAGRNVARGDVDPRAWYNFPIFIELCTAVDRRFGRGDLVLNVECARWGAHHSVPSLYQPFIRLGSVDWLLGRATKLWNEHFSAGQLVVRHQRDQSHCEGEILDFPQPSMALIYSVMGFAMGCLELSGAKDVKGDLVTARARGGDRDLCRLHWT